MKKNIIIMTDQQRADLPAREGYPLDTTPAMDWIGERNTDEPFIAEVSFPEPHNPYQCPEPYSSMFPAEDLPPLESSAEDAVLKGMPYVKRRELQLNKKPNQDNKLPKVRSISAHVSLADIMPTCCESMRKKIAKAGLASFAGISLLPTIFAEPAEPVMKKRPNIIIILADDMGYSDVLCDDINTPNLDMMAKNGVTFSQFYNNAKCSPTRSSLLTGSYNVRKDRNKPHLPTAMQDAGYLTGMVGKVHGHTTRGFTRDFTVLRGSFNFFNPEEPEAHNRKAGRKKSYKIHIDGKVAKGWKSPEGFYTTDNFTDYGMSYMDDAKKQGKPFFLYMAYNAPHWPLQAWPEDIAKYKGKYKKDFDLIRVARYKKLIECGILPEKFKLSPRDEDLTAWNTLSDAEKEEFDTLLATHAAMVDRLDQNIGRLLEKLKAIGEENNTLIMFLSDNGAAASMGGNKTTPEVPIGAKGSFAGIGLRGANLSCTPFRKVKTWNHEGGISTPLIAYWGGNIKDKGRVVDSPAHVIDILPTCLEVAGIDQDGVKNAKEMDGISYYPLLKNKEWVGHSEIYWQFGQAKAVRQGDWKLVAHKKLSNGEWELYDMKEDRTELNNLASQNPEKVKELGLLWETWYKNCGEK